MAKINKLKKDVAGVSTTVYPVTVPQAVVDPADNKTLATKLTEIDDSVSQLAGEVVLKEATENKQNSLTTDGTGTKFPTVDAVNGGIALLPNSLIAEYTYNGNIEIRVESVDTDTSTFTKTAHGLSNGAIIFPVYDGDLWKAFTTPINIYAGGMLQKIYYVVNKTNDTFQISETSGGAPLTITVNANLNLNGWHFEWNVNNNGKFALDGLSLPDNFRVDYDLIFEGYFTTRQLQYYSQDWYTDDMAIKGYDASLITGSLFCKWIIEYHFSQTKAWYNVKQIVYYVENATKTRKVIRKDENRFSNSFTTANKNTSIGLLPFSGRTINLANKSTFKITRL